jgi:hypothetical protein
MREGSTPRFRTCSISFLEAQSKPVPRADSSSRSFESELHLTARAECQQEVEIRAMHRVLTIERLDARQVQLPAQMLAVNLAEIGDKEGVLFSSFAEFVVNAFNTLAESVSD